MSSTGTFAVATLEYRDIALPRSFSLPLGLLPDEPAPAAPLPPLGFTEAQVLEHVQQARAEAIAETETRLRSEWSLREAQLNSKVSAAVHAFVEERAAYFRGVEAEVVHLALAIARKILEREAALDPTLLAALVRIALDRMGAAPAVRLRVCPKKLPWWKTHGGLETKAGTAYAFELLADSSLDADDCLVETQLGMANFGFEAQLKEIEKGFLDLLACKPGER